MKPASVWTLPARAHQIEPGLVREENIGPIEKGIPIPPSRRGDGTLRERMRILKVGESFKTKYSNKAVMNWVRKLRIKCETRKLGDGYMRVWRIE